MSALDEENTRLALQISIFFDFRISELIFFSASGMLSRVRNFGIAEGYFYIVVKRLEEVPLLLIS